MEDLADDVLEEQYFDRVEGDLWEEDLIGELVVEDMFGVDLRKGKLVEEDLEGADSMVEDMVGVDLVVEEDLVGVDPAVEELMVEELVVEDAVVEGLEEDLVGVDSAVEDLVAEDLVVEVEDLVEELGEGILVEEDLVGAHLEKLLEEVSAEGDLVVESLKEGDLAGGDLVAEVFLENFFHAFLASSG